MERVTTLVGMHVVKVVDSYALRQESDHGLMMWYFYGTDGYDVAQGRIVGQAPDGDVLVEWDNGVTRVIADETMPSLNLFNTREKADAYAATARTRNEAAIARRNDRLAAAKVRREAEEAAAQAKKRHRPRRRQ